MLTLLQDCREDVRRDEVDQSMVALPDSRPMVGYN